MYTEPRLYEHEYESEEDRMNRLARACVLATLCLDSWVDDESVTIQ